MALTEQGAGAHHLTLDSRKGAAIQVSYNSRFSGTVSGCKNLSRAATPHPLAGCEAPPMRMGYGVQLLDVVKPDRYMKVHAKACQRVEII